MDSDPGWSITYICCWIMVYRYNDVNPICNMICKINYKHQNLFIHNCNSLTMHIAFYLENATSEVIDAADLFLIITILITLFYVLYSQHFYLFL